MIYALKTINDALGTPVVAIFGSTDLQKTIPVVIIIVLYDIQSIVPPCMLGVKAEAVVDAARELLTVTGQVK